LLFGYAVLLASGGSYAPFENIASRLDHALLNKIGGLEDPSLENLCLWIWRRLKPRFSGLARVTVRRDSLGQSCTYRGPV